MSETTTYSNPTLHESQKPITVPPSQAQAAQIPLQSFSLPDFPPEAQNLTSLTLTSDINLSEYTSLLTPSTPPIIPPLPHTISNLTLELFSLGYPPPFLSTLSNSLPNLKTLILYSQLFCGTTPSSLTDSINFFQNQKGIIALHLLDIFIPSSTSAKFFDEISPTLKESLKFLEVNYTFRHSDPEFLRNIPGKGLVGLVGRELVSCVFGMSGPDRGGDEDDREGEEEGILPLGGDGVKELVGVLVGEERPKGLLALDVTLYKLDLEQLKEILEVQRELKILAITLELKGDGGEGVKGIIEVLGLCGGLEEVEIVGFPGDEGFVERVKAGGDVGVAEDEIVGLGEKCSMLKSVKVSILRTREVVWEKVDGKWKKI